MKALELMKTHVVKTNPGATLAQAVDLMDLYYVTGLPVVDEEEHLCGLLMDSDVLRATQGTSDTDANSTKGAIDSFFAAQPTGNRLVEDFMQRMVITVPEDAEVSTVLPMLLDGTVDRVPVLDGRNRVVGMLHRVDVLQALFEGQFS